ncbi:MAG: NADH-quinone oxidoreductase subunit M [Magnetococcales bacterium]|nr:NADH-quinone oxidoreductase subunit M [Magnetococcales bacterium]
MTAPLLSLLLLFTLPFGTLLIWTAGGSATPDRARWIALGAALVDLALTLAVVAGFDPGKDGFQFVERTAWIPSLNLHYHVGVDGLSVLFLPLTVVLFLGVILSSWNSVRLMPRLYYTLVLLLEHLILGVFCALDTILFFLFWEMTLLPIYFLIGFWGVGPRRRYAAVKYTLFMLAGGVPLLLAFVLLAFHQDPTAGTDLVFDYPTLLAAPLAGSGQTLLFFLLLLGFAVKVPVFPLHTWLPTLAMEGTPSVAALMTGLKLGAYGLLRFLIPLAPTAAQEYHWLLAGLGVAGLLYGALLALVQTNLRRMLAYASLSHVGLVVLGLSSGDLPGLQGALFQLLNFTVVAGGLFLLTGFLHHRTGSTDLIDLGGAATTMPLLAASFLLLGLASLGLPGTSGFPAEFLILVSVLEHHTGAGLAALTAMGGGAAYCLGMFRRAFLGPVRSRVIQAAEDLRPREMLVALVLGALVLLPGFFPGLILDLTRQSAESWVRTLTVICP